MIRNVFWFLSIIAAFKVINAINEYYLESFDITPETLYVSSLYRLAFEGTTVNLFIANVSMKKHGLKIVFAKDERIIGNPVVLKRANTDDAKSPRIREFTGTLNGSFYGAESIYVVGYHRLADVPVTRRKSLIEDVIEYANESGDFTNQVENGEELKASSFILADRCLFFRSYFSGRWTSNPFLFKEVSFDSVKDFIKYLTSEDLPENANVGEIFELANRYQCDSAKSQLRFTLFQDSKIKLCPSSRS